MTSAAFHVQQARHHLETGNAAQALADAEQGLAAHPHDDALQLVAAQGLMALGRFAEAATRLDTLTAAAPGMGEAWMRLGACRLHVGDTPGAVDALERGVALAPEAFIARLQLAEGLQVLGRTEEALVQFFRAVTTAQAKGRWLNDTTTVPDLRDRVRQAMATIDAGRHALFSNAVAPLVEQHGADDLRRVVHALEGYLGLRPAGSPDPRQKPTFFYVPDLQPEPYFDRTLFPWYAALEQATDAIRAELQQVLAARKGLQPFLDFSGGARKSDFLDNAHDLDAAAWDGYFFYRHGQAYAGHLAACPVTSAVLAQVPLTRIDGHAPEVLFSLLSPGTVIKPHHGVTNSRVVTHLPLIVPPDCALEVGGVEHAWAEGRCVTFDDSFLHAAWNRSDRLRVVMILDTWHPRLREVEVQALTRLVETIGAFNARAGVA
ncbi:aspartyl/asparaginyl beta-hydroxylase domain-containing protein [Pseudoxanthomonas sp.]|uniref:aspartyl/asparaginyl beta-hydroxylase domain-containing protein n=1 Tax=Pseudoxanthomonas sp. TaxID=1871049 RepID=UPI002FE1BBED